MNARSRVAGALARLHLARGDLELAEGTVRRALRQVRGDLPWRLRLLTLLTEVLLRRRDLAGAERAAGEALEIATLTERPGLLALANLAAARAAAARGADPVPQLEEALRALGGLDRPVLAADIRLELAQAERDSNSASAIGEAQAALGAFERLGMGREADRAGALLRSLGVRASRSRPAQQASATLTRREREILALLGEGLTNAEIARRLFISSRTAEHHVASVLGKLGLRRRAEAAAMAGSGKPGAG